MLKNISSANIEPELSYVWSFENIENNNHQDRLNVPIYSAGNLCQLLVNLRDFA